MARTRVATMALATVVVSGLLTGCGQSWRSTLVSVNAAGADSGNGESIWPRVSADGTKIAFTSAAGNLGPTDSPRPPDPNPEQIDTNWDVYVKDLTTGEVTLVSANAAGTDSGNGRSWDPLFSPDGTKVAFISSASDLGPADPGDPVWDTDIYVRDLTTGEIHLVTSNAAGTDGQGGWFPDFSPDGTRITFSSGGSDYGVTDTNGTDDVYMRDLTSGEATLISINAAGNDSANSYSAQPAFSPDGTKVLFDSHASNLGPPDANGVVDVYVRDLVAGSTSLVSVEAAGTDGGDGASSRAQFSADGRRILFESDASDLGAVDTNGVKDLYVRDIVAGSTILVTVNHTEARAGNGPVRLYEFGPDSSSVLFDSDAEDLVTNDQNGRGDVFVRDIDAGTTTLVSVNATGTTANHHSFLQAFSPDGTKVAFVSYANDFGPNDTPRPGPSAFFSGDIYVRDLAAGTTTLLSANAAGTDSANGHSSGDRPAFVSETSVAFQSVGSNFGPTDTNQDDDIYLATFR